MTGVMIFLFGLLLGGSFGFIVAAMIRAGEDDR